MGHFATTAAGSRGGCARRPVAKRRQTAPEDAMIPAPRRLMLAAALVVPAVARAQQQRPVTIIVPFAAGGSTDVLSRLMAERMTQTLGQTVLVENRAGGNTIVGAEYVARAQPDGNTLLMAAG